MRPRRFLTRRSFLRGVVAGSTVSLALPPLEAMFSSGGAWADGSVDQPIFGIFFWANGLPWHAGHTRSARRDPGFDAARHLDLWTPSTTGAGYTPSELLMPIAAHEPTVITGLEPKTEWVTDGEADGHMRGFMVALTSDRVNPVGFYHNSHTLTAERESLDQYVAKHPSFYGGSPPRYRSLALGVSTARFHNYGHWNAISYNGPNSLNVPISDAGQLFDLLFSVPAEVTTLGKRAQLLDSVLEEYRGLRVRLGAGDRRRLDEHMTHIDEIQRRLESSALVCEGPGARPSTSAQLLDQVSIMSRLLALGLQCGQTRVFSFMMTSPATPHLFSDVPGVVNDMHTTCHLGAWEAVRGITVQHMRGFARLLDELAAVPASMSRSVLDNCLVYGTSEYGEGWKHGVEEMPAVLAGGACGRLRSGWHVREPGGNMAKAHVTMLRALGLPTASYGFHGSETSDEFASLYA